MRQITITPSIDALAERYQKMLTAQLPIATMPTIVTMNLPQYVESLKSNFEAPAYSIKEPYDDGGLTRWRDLGGRDRYANYLRVLKEQLDNNLLVVHPSKFQKVIDTFKNLLTPEEMGRKMKLGTRANAATKTFTEIIQEVLCYKEIRKTVFPQFVRELGIKTCVYCNTQYAVTDEDDRGYYQLDHWKPESEYPYLCACFFNLQPSCATCNLHKNADVREYHSIWNESNIESDELYRFSLTKGSLARYLMTHHSDELKVDMVALKKPEQLELLIEKLHIDKLYDQLTDVAEEVVWKRIVYDQGYIEALRSAISKKALGLSEINRFVQGNYDRPEDIHKRPMAKLTQDVAKQLGVI